MGIYCWWRSHRVVACFGRLLWLRKRKKEEMDERPLQEEQVAVQIPDVNEEVETEATLRRKQLEKLAKEKPEEFAKLLRTWLAEE